MQDGRYFAVFHKIKACNYLHALFALIRKHIIIQCKSSTKTDRQQCKKGGVSLQPSVAKMALSTTYGFEALALLTFLASVIAESVWRLHEMKFDDAKKTCEHNIGGRFVELTSIDRVQSTLNLHCEYLN